MSADFQTRANALARRVVGTAATPWLNEFRSRGTARFGALPLPTLKTEAWKYTSLRGLFEADVLHPPPTSTRYQDVVPDVANRLVLVNGTYIAEASRLNDLDGIECVSFEHADPSQRAVISQCLGRIADDAEHPFLALNEGMTDKGVFVRANESAAVRQPLHLFHVDTDTGVSRFARVLIVLSPRSELTLIEHYVSAESVDASTQSFTSSVTEVKVMDSARLVHCRIQSSLAPSYHIAGVYADLDQAASYELHQLTLPSRMTRNDIRVRMLAPGGSCVLNGIYLCRERQHVDNHTSIEHCAPHCTSREDFHGIVIDRSRAVFHGRVHIYPGAQQSDARLHNRNLLLSADAEVDTKPELEIYADDVKCAHGATVGELDADAMFYLMSRGIDPDTAESLLIRGFAKARIDQMPTAWVRERIEDLLFPRLEAHGER